MILGRTWLEVRRPNFNKTYNTLWICNNGACYQIQVRPFDMVPFIPDLSDKKEPNGIKPEGGGDRKIFFCM